MGLMHTLPPQKATAHGAPAYWYSIYGLSVRSEVPLPVTSTLPGPLATPDVVVRRILSGCPLAPDWPAVAQISCPVHGTHMREYRRPDGVWIWLQAIGTFRVAPNATSVDVYPDEGADEQALGLALAGPVLVFVRHKLGCPSLHASAIVTARGAVGFLGPRGRGKSSMAAAFLRRGARLLTDDALALVRRDDGIYGAPGPAFMKVWHETARHTLELAEELPNLMASLDKKLLAVDGRYVRARTPARLQALFVLDRYDPLAADRTDVTFRPLRGREALVALLISTSNRAFLLPADEALSIRIYAQLLAQVPVHVLSYPDGFGYQDAVHQRILDHLEEQ